MSPTSPPVDRTAWKELRATLERFVARRVAAGEVEDVLHEVFVRIARGLPALRNGDRVTAWVYQIARNAIADHYRGPAGRRQAHGEIDADAIEHPTDEDPRATAELVRDLRQLIHLLPAKYREALEMTDLDGMTQTEAAARLGLSVPGMKSRVQRARAQLRGVLDACCDIELDARGRIIECEPRTPPATLPDCCTRSGG